MSKLLENSGNGFQESTDIDLSDFTTISVDLWQDYDNDGDFFRKTGFLNLGLYPLDGNETLP